MQKDSPGVYIPPPLVYVLVFLIALFIQKKISFNDSLFHLEITRIFGIVLFGVALFFLFTSLRIFFKSKNTLILIRPASSLQTNGIYNISRNPMYVGLACIYLGITCFIGNWWDLILFPILVLIIQQFIIYPEEKYLYRRFGQAYLDYKLKVRRWV
jgi:protein-S-isoprenylcysteine O-methyltransferase Ste14